MKKIVTLFFAVMFCVTATMAQTVPQDEAADYANRVFRMCGKSATRSVSVERRGADTLYYIFHTDNGFAVISADRRTQPLLAFSDEQPFAEGAVAPPAQMWLTHYADQLAELRTQPFRPEDAHPAWSRTRGELRPETAIAPFLRSNWGQGSQYNYYCPKDINGEGGRVVTGCVATAMAQLMYYFRFPETGTGTYSYTDENYGVQSADYGNTTYDFSAMCDKATSINTAISTLMYHCGVGVDMVYGPDGSGMYNHSAANVLKTYFKYSPDTHYEFRDSTTLDWDSLIVSHLERNIPLYYAGWSVPNVNGHAFICDGYRLVDSANYYHFNFGWDGQSNGYFYTNSLTTGGSHFNLAQELIINAYPDTLQYEYPTPQPLTGTTVMTTRDGSFLVGGACGGSYASNIDRTWVIQPDVPHLTAIRLDITARIGEGDTMFVSTDNPTIAPMAFTGDSAKTLSLSCSEVTIRFVSDGEVTSQGVSVSYSSVTTVFCETSPLLTASSGTITDGSEDEDYNPLSFCKFRIKVTGNPAIRLVFREFELEEGHDSLHIYKFLNQNITYLTSLTGSMEEGTEMVFNTNRLLFVFESDEQNNAAGFTFDFEGVPVTDIPDHANLSVSIWPNPSSSEVYVTIGEEATSSSVVLQLCDLFGRKLEEKICAKAGETVSFNVSGLAKGVYFVRIMTEDGSMVTRKIVRQ